MNVRFAVNVGSRDASYLGLDPQACKEGSVVDIPEGKVDEIKAVCGQAAIIGVGKKDAKAEPSDADLEKLTAPEKKK